MLCTCGLRFVVASVGGGGEREGETAFPGLSFWYMWRNGRYWGFRVIFGVGVFRVPCQSSMSCSLAVLQRLSSVFPLYFFFPSRVS